MNSSDVHLFKLFFSCEGVQLVGQAILPAADIPVGDLRGQANSANVGCGYAALRGCL